MNAKLLKIGLERFESGKFVARDVFLHLPLNGKMVRLVSAGEEIRPELLERLKLRGVSSLYMTPLPEESPDVANLVLFKSEESSRITVVAASPELVSSVALNGAPDEEEHTLKVAGSDQSGEEGTQTVKGTRDAALEVSTLRAIPAEAESSTTIGGRSKKEGGSYSLIRTDSLLPEPQALPVDEGTLPESHRAELDVVTAETLHLLANPEDFADPAPALVPGHHIASESVIETKVTSRNKKSEIIPDQPLVVVQDTKEVATSDDNRDVPDENLQLSFEIGEAREELPLNFPGSQTEPSLIRGLLTGAERGPGKEKKEEVGSAALALKELSPHSKQALIYRDLPFVAARLAAYLGHSLGYQHFEFLSDLALGTILRFSSGKEFPEDCAEIPPFSRRIANGLMEGPDAPLEEALAILNFLEIYFLHPECDKTHKEFSSRLFHLVLEESARRGNKIDPWSECKWSQFVQKGASIEAISLCSKASAKAAKTLKTLNTSAAAT